jgi:hypothetical protein
MTPESSISSVSSVPSVGSMAAASIGDLDGQHDGESENGGTLISSLMTTGNKISRSMLTMSMWISSLISLVGFRDAVCGQEGSLTGIGSGEGADNTETGGDGVDVDDMVIVQDDASSSLEREFLKWRHGDVMLFVLVLVFALHVVKS